MIKLKSFFILFLSIILLIIVWRGFLLFTSLSKILIEDNLDSSQIFQSQIKSPEVTNKAITFSSLQKNTSITTGNYETIDETISRLKRDVVVTGTIIGMPGGELAIFQIEGMAGRSFNINTQLMDGFIITEITENQVVLKNQVGDEIFSLKVQ